MLNSVVTSDDSLMAILFFLAPEIYLFCLIFIVLLYSLVSNKYFVNAGLINFQIFFVVPFLVGLLGLLVFQFDCSGIFFNGYFCVNKLVNFSKILMTIFLILIFLMSSDYFRAEKFQVTEYIIISLLAVLGMFLLVSSNDFVVFYLALEMVSFCLYILASLKRYSNLSIEAALKYFVFGSFSSGMLLFGISILYSFFGSTNFFDVNALLWVAESFLDYPVLFLLALLLISVGILFKLAIFPFHFWIADVYEGAPMAVTAFFAIVPKLPFLVIFVKLYFFVLVKLFDVFSFIFFFLGLFSIVIGILLSLYEMKIKRLLAYSAITHMGYLIISLSLFSNASIDAFLIYSITYALSIITIFAILLSVRKGKSFYEIKSITDLSVLRKSNPYLAFVFSLSLLSLAGIPPLAGFFGKFFIFSTLISVGASFSTGVIILLTVVSSIYYIRLIRLAFFNNFTVEDATFSCQISWSTGFVILLCFGLNLTFFFFQPPLLIILHMISVDFWNLSLWFLYHAWLN